MSSSTPNALGSNRSSSTSQTFGSNRILACVACRQRKIRCSRSFPCTNCQALALDCTPAIPVTRRRTRHVMSYKRLLEQIHSYENLLRKHDIQFRSIENDSDSKFRSSVDHLDEDMPATPHTGESNDDFKATPEAMSPKQKASASPRFAHRNAMLKQIAQIQGRQVSSQDDDDEFEHFEYDPWESGNARENSLVFRSFEVNLDFSSLHPDPAQIFQLWQIYLDNVNPLLKVSHQPTLQAEIVKFMQGRPKQAPSSEFNALMFAIYCIAIQSLQDDDCQAILDSAKPHLLQIYHFACEQALHACNFLATKNCDCLRALLLYLMSQGAKHDPRSISAMTAAAVRIAERIGIDVESQNTRLGLFEAEMRRRLWWALMLFDQRVTGVSSSGRTAWNAKWDCKLPLNINDMDLRPEIKNLPKSQTSELQQLPSDNIFPVLRAEVAMFKRPALGDSAPSYYRDVEAFKTRINNLYLQTCSEDNPSQFATLWMTRAFIAKFQLLDSPELRIQHAIELLNCDTKMMSSALVRGYIWFFELYFPLPGYIHIAVALKQDPSGCFAEQAWEALANNHYARFPDFLTANTQILDLCNKAVLFAWHYQEKFLSEQKHGLPVASPRVVSRIHEHYHGVPALLDALQNDKDLDLFEQDFFRTFQMPGASYN